MAEYEIKAPILIDDKKLLKLIRRIRRSKKEDRQYMMEIAGEMIGILQVVIPKPQTYDNAQKTLPNKRTIN